MWLLVDAHYTVTLEDPGNFRAFKIVIEAPSDRLSAARDALSGIADLLTPDEAWVHEAALRAYGPDRDWQSGLSAMIEKARPHGWINPETGAIKAHVEWT